jgi:serine protease Do
LTDDLAIVEPQPINEFNPLTLGAINLIKINVAQYDATNDVALLKISQTLSLDAPDAPDNIFGDEHQIMVGSSVAYLGYPFGHLGLHALKLSSSIISAKVISTNTRQYQLDTMVHEGNSGGPLFDIATGRIIGIISGRFSPIGSGGGFKMGNHTLGTESSISYATTISYGKELLKSEGLNV